MTQGTDAKEGIQKIGLSTLFVLAIMLMPAGSAWGRREVGSKPSTGLPERISNIAVHLTGTRLDESPPLTNEIEKLVVAHLDRWMADRSPNIVEVQQELDRVFSKLLNPAYENSRAFQAPWNGSNLIGAGYTLGWSDIWRTSVVVLFECRGGHCSQAALAHFVPGNDLHYLVLPAGPSGDFRFIIYGTRLGKSHPRLSANLYSFDGKKLESLWEIRDKFDGTLTRQGDQILVRYLEEGEFIRATTEGRRPPRYESVYQIAPQGLKFVADHVVPY